MTVRRREGGRESGSRESERRRNSKLGVSSSGDIGNPDGITSSRIFRLAASKATPDARRPVGLGGTDYLNLSLSIRAQEQPIKLLFLQPRRMLAAAPWGWEERILWIYPCRSRSESKNNLLSFGVCRFIFFGFHPCWTLVCASFVCYSFLTSTCVLFISSTVVE